MQRYKPLLPSPLASGTTPLSRRWGVTRQSGIRPGRRGSASGKLIPPAPGEFTAKVKLLVRKRAGRGDIYEAACEACGRHLGEKAGEFQHRAARGAGGCRDAVINGPANCAFMCPGCHGKAEARDPHLGMDAGGFWLKHGTTPEFDPRNVPIMLHGEGGGMTAWLAPDGRYLFEDPKDVAA